MPQPKTDEFGLVPPDKPTDAERVEYEAWLVRYTEVQKTAEEHRWLAWTGGYEGEWVPQTPDERYREEQSAYESARWRIEHQRRTDAEEQLKKKAEKAAKRAAEAARERVMRSGR